MSDTSSSTSNSEEHTAHATQAARARRPRAARKTSQAAKVGITPATPIPAKEADLFGRIDVLDVRPAAGDGAFAPRVGLGEPFDVSAQVLMEGRSTVGATAVLKTVRGRVMARVPMTRIDAREDRWSAVLRAGEYDGSAPWDEGFDAVRAQLGVWKVAVEGWHDVYADWLVEARAAVERGEDVEYALGRGAELLARWAANRDAGLDADERRMMRETAKAMRDATIPAEDRLAIACTDELRALHASNPLRDGLTASPDRVFHVERPKSVFSAWYRFSPRSEGASRDPGTGRVAPGTLASAASGLERAKDEGFDAVLLTSVLPVDAEAGAGRQEPGVAAHDAVDPALGTPDDMRALCERAHALGLEVAIGLPMRFAPEHPWVREHPSWFRANPDGTLAPVRDGRGALLNLAALDPDADRAGVERELERVLEWWIDLGVTAFAVDDAGDVPARLWQDVIGAVTKRRPEILFLSGAGRRPAMARALSYAGFTQTRSRFPWANTKDELERFLGEANGERAFHEHDVCWPVTPDAASDYLRANGGAGHAVRAVLAAMGSPSWGLTSGYELGEIETVGDGATEARVRDWAAAGDYGVGALVTALNRIRAGHPSARGYHTLSVLPSANPAIVAFARHTPAAYTGTGKPDTLIVVVNLDCTGEQQSSIHVDLDRFGLPTDGTYRVHDELTGHRFDWSWDNFVSLAPWSDVAHVLSVEY